MREALVLAGLLAGAAAVAELSRRVERLRRLSVVTPHVNMTSVWTLAGALLLPPSLAAALVVGVYAYLWARSWRRVHGFQPHRVAFNTATIILACHSTEVVLQLSGVDVLRAPLSAAGCLVLIVVIAVYAAVNSAIVAGVIGLNTSKWKPVHVLGTWSENALEIATLGLGVVVAVFVPTQPLSVLFLVPTLLVLHRAVLVRHLEHAAVTDRKTGVLEIVAWHQLARQELDRGRDAGFSTSLLLIDIDGLRSINQHYGEVAGDAVLTAVANCLRAQLRECDLLGRSGGEEFLALLPGVNVEDLPAVTERIRTRVEQLIVTKDAIRVRGLSVTIGAAVHPEPCEDLDGLLLAADNALFAAKDAGRGQVRILETSPARTTSH